MQTMENVFPKGDTIPPQYAAYFTGTAWLHMLVPNHTAWNCPIGNVTFEPGARNNWHKHAGGQILLVTAGKGWYQEAGKAAQALRPGDVVLISAGVKHWHGAAADCALTHLAVETNPQAGSAEWLEPVDEAAFAALPATGDA